MQRFRIANPVDADGAERIKQAVLALPGVKAAAVMVDEGALAVDFAAPATREDICRKVEELGFGLLLPQADRRDEATLPAACPPARLGKGPVARALVWVACLAAALGLLALGGAGALPLSLTPSNANGAGPASVLLELVPLVLAGCAVALALPLWRCAAAELKARTPGVALPPALSAAVLLGYGLYRLAVTLAGVLKVDSAAMAAYRPGAWFAGGTGVLAAGLAALLLRDALAARAAMPFEKLAALAPATAHRLEPECAGNTDQSPAAAPAPRETAVAAAELQPGDRFVVSPGELVPADGLVEEGQSSLTFPALAGADPAEVLAGDALPATAKNGDGTLICRASRTGAATDFARSLQAAKLAADTPLPLPEPVARLLPRLLPATMAAALAVALLWLALGKPEAALTTAAAVLAAACPSALLNAAPALAKAGCGAGLGHGLLYRDAAALAKPGTAKALVLDRPCVVADGEPKVVAVIGTRKVPEKFLLGLAAGLELPCDHPVARAVLARARAAGVPLRPVANFAALPGKGLTGTIAGKVVAGGGAEFIGSQAQIEPALLDAAAALKAQGATALFFSLDRHAAGLIGVADVVRPASRPALAALQALGLRVWLCTTESSANAAHLAGQLGLPTEQTLAQLPANGLAAIAAEKRGDAPALAASTCAENLPAEGAITVLAGLPEPAAPLPLADLTLLAGDLSGLPAAVKLGQSLPGTLQTALWAGAAVQLALLLLAAGVLYPVCGLLLSPPLAALLAALAGALPYVLAARWAAAAFAAPAAAPAAEPDAKPDEKPNAKSDGKPDAKPGTDVPAAPAKK